MKRGWSVAAPGALVICVAGCGGGSSNGRLSSRGVQAGAGEDLETVRRGSWSGRAERSERERSLEVEGAAECRGGIRAVLPKLARFKSVQQAFGYLQQLGSMKGGREQDQAISQLKKLGHTSGS